MHKTKLTRAAFACLALCATAPVFAQNRYQELTLEQCIQIALENHRSMAVSQASLQAAEAQYRQAMSAYWPRVSIETNFQRADQDRTFTFQGSVQTPAMSVQTPLGAFPIASQTLPMNMDVKLFDRDTTTSSLSVTAPLYTGGKLDAIAGMAKKGIEIAKEEKRKTELEVVRDVRRYYFGTLFAQEMEKLATDTTERFVALEDLTEKLYQNASLKVKKTDYLRSKTTTALVRNMRGEARYASAMAREALTNAMGLPITSSVSLAPAPKVQVIDPNLEALLKDARSFNPDVQRLELAVQAADYKIAEARSGYYPVVGFKADAYRVWNDYKGGLFNNTNSKGWTIGLGVRWDIFSGFETQSAVDVARAGKIRLEGQRVLLDQGLALQVKDAFLRIQRSKDQAGDAEKAKQYAQENRDLNFRAYQEEMVETKDVIEAQIMESMAASNYYRSLHELQAALADLDYLVGKGLQQSINTK